MARSTSVPVVPGTRSIPLREDFLGLCNREIDTGKRADPYCRAMVLTQILHLVEVRLEEVRQAVRLNEAGEQSAVEPTADMTPWVYISQEQMRVDLLGLFGRRPIMEAYAWLTEQGWIAWRKHPKYRGYQFDQFDHTRQWTVNVAELRMALDCWASANGYSYEPEVGESARSEVVP